MCGIGGRTIEEAQRNISYPEFLSWIAYRQKRGSLNTGMRVERGSALLSALYVNAHKKKDAEPVKLYDFMPHEDKPAISLDQAMDAWR